MNYILNKETVKPKAWYHYVIDVWLVHCAIIVFGVASLLAQEYVLWYMPDLIRDWLPNPF